MSGGVLVGVIAAVPYLFWDGQLALRISLLLLATLPGIAGVVIARLRDRSWPFSLFAGAAVYLIALGVVLVKATLMH